VQPPVALCEVQGYCIDAYARGARLMLAMGETEAAGRYEARSRALRERFEREFWSEEHERYAFALDGEGRQVTTLVSNAGHLLWSRAVPRDRARAIARNLLSPASYSGFGIRTLAAGQPAYNPLSYHNGTVWPHDNSLIAEGLANYDLGEDALRIFEGLYQALQFFSDSRLPELFCGIDRKEGPLVRYPVACSPQAWASGAMLLILQAVLGISPQADVGRLVIRNPRLPAAVGTVHVRGLRIGGSRVELRFKARRSGAQVDKVVVTGEPLRVEIQLD
jgi:glycogen debranching enzyme